jgi:hypothetical protein
MWHICNIVIHNGSQMVQICIAAGKAGLFLLAAENENR